MTVCNDVVREIAEAIIGNLDENGYLSASLEEISQNGKYSMEDVEEALAVVQEFDPLGVASRNLRECLLTQLRTLDSQNALAQQIVSECLPKRPLAASEAEEQNPETPLARLLQANQLKEIARALNRPGGAGEARRGRRSRSSIRAPACATTRRSRAWSSRMCISAKWTTSGKCS